MNLLGLFAFVVYAAEAFISPIPNGTPVVVPPPTKPAVSFGEITLAPSPTPLASPSATPAPTPTPLHTKKKSYIIAFLGDSMIDTMGPDLPAVQNKLSSLYTSTNFILLNYGVGGTNIDYGIQRISSSYTYLNSEFPSLASTHPDIVVLESFGYNPFPDADGGVNRHWLALSKAVSALHSAIPAVKVVIAATIAPNSKVFGDGALDIAFSPDDKIERTKIIKRYLENAVNFARSEHLPIADVYHASLDSGGEGNLTYINSGDHIHYSDKGRALFAERVVRAIQTVL